MLRVLRRKTLNINSVADLKENTCRTLPALFSIYLLTFKTVSTEIMANCYDPKVACQKFSEKGGDDGEEAGDR